MGKLNLIAGAWEGKVGKLVGAKWKSTDTIRQYAIPSDPHTPAQVAVREEFKEVSSYFAYIAPLLIGRTALDLKNKTIRNSIMHLNKELIAAHNTNFKQFLISKGPLPQPSAPAWQVVAATATGTATWTSAPSVLLSSAAKCIVVACSPSNHWATIIEAPYTANTASVPGVPASAADLIVYGYVLDKRGSSKAASASWVFNP